MTKIFNLGSGCARLRTMFDLFNLFNANAVTREQPRLRNDLVDASGDHPGRLAKFAFQFDF